MANSADYLQEFIQLLLADDTNAAVARSKELLEEGMDILEFFDQLLSRAMGAVGELFGQLEIFLPELMSAAETAKAISEQVVYPAILESKGEAANLKRGKVVLGSVKGDIHDIGKNMVALMLEVNGFEVVDIGIDVNSREFIDRALSEGADIVGLSALMTTSMPYMEEVVQMRDGFGHRDKFAIIVGGAQISAAYCQKIGAEAFGKDAAEAVKVCLELMKKRTKRQ
jgi:methylmalonyl-CoA mutase cobalamin-binding domain/chain